MIVMAWDSIDRESHSDPDAFQAYLNWLGAAYRAESLDQNDLAAHAYLRAMSIAAENPQHFENNDVLDAALGLAGVDRGVLATNTIRDLNQTFSNDESEAVYWQSLAMFAALTEGETGAELAVTYVDADVSAFDASGIYRSLAESFVTRGELETATQFLLYALNAQGFDQVDRSENAMFWASAGWIAARAGRCDLAAPLMRLSVLVDTIREVEWRTRLERATEVSYRGGIRLLIQPDGGQAFSYEDDRSFPGQSRLVIRLRTAARCGRMDEVIADIWQYHQHAGGLNSLDLAPFREAEGFVDPAQARALRLAFYRQLNADLVLGMPTPDDDWQRVGRIKILAYWAYGARDAGHDDLSRVALLRAIELIEDLEGRALMEALAWIAAALPE